MWHMWKSISCSEEDDCTTVMFYSPYIYMLKQLYSPPEVLLDSRACSFLLVYRRQKNKSVQGELKFKKR